MWKCSLFLIFSGIVLHIREFNLTPSVLVPELHLWNPISRYHKGSSDLIKSSDEMFTCSHNHFLQMKYSATNCKGFIKWCHERKKFHFAQKQSVPNYVLQRSLALWSEGAKTDSSYQGEASRSVVCVFDYWICIPTQQGAQRKRPCGYSSTHSRRHPGIPFVNMLFRCMSSFEGVNLILLAHLSQGQCQLLWWETKTACGASKLPFV